MFSIGHRRLVAVIDILFCPIVISQEEIQYVNDGTGSNSSNNTGERLDTTLLSMISVKQPHGTTLSDT